MSFVNKESIQNRVYDARSIEIPRKVLGCRLPDPKDTRGLLDELLGII